ncbi:tetratricopeptide repeat protein [Pseudodesulfovibrio sp. F-1]|uniref:Tetratricopeptide repeat protein n=1 Tax=Pseudodesulfovibrio alkaliphilus TaxID=2661613 RepID=A0A7K1KQQ7_9BACT|nr:tetratricopeptide repeat protein [Pseudodesulfovibrio alkaliphilus]MUM78436.1 tetratricopeptide repeat protein [Pseudodesulfovibrio alkaliphilus]
MGKHKREREAEAVRQQHVRKSTCILLVVAALLAGTFLGNALTMIYVGQREGHQAVVSGFSGQSGTQASPHAADSAILARLEADAAADSTNPDAWVALGNYCFDHDLPAKGAAAYERAVELAPMRPGVWSDLGVMYRRTERFDKAIDAFSHAASLDPSHITSRFNMGVVYLHDLGDRENALKVWREVLAIDPSAVTPTGRPVAALVSELEK